MELFSPEFFAALGAIILIDLVLAGDNAIVIALAARRLPPDLRTKAIVFGTVGAVVVRSLLTLMVVWLLKIPGLMLVGGLALLWIAVKLIAPGDESGHGEGGATTFWGAMRTIVIADAVMGIDNVLAVAGAAHGSFALVVLGLLISIPIVVWGSRLVLQLIERFPVIIYAGATVLAWTAAKMITAEPLLKGLYAAAPGLSWLVYAAAILGTLGVGLARSRSGESIDVTELTGATPAPLPPLPVPVPRKETAMSNVLIPFDGSKASLEALRQVVRDRLEIPGLRVQLLHLVPCLNRHMGRFVSRANREAHAAESAARALAPAEQLLAESGIAYQRHVVRAWDIPEEICRQAARLDCTRIVVGSLRHNPITRLLTLSVTARLLDRSPVPVEVVLAGDAPWYARIAIPAGVGVALAALALD